MKLLSQAIAGIRVAVALILVILAAASTARADVDCDMRAPENLTIGTLAFRNVERARYIITGQSLRNSTVYCNFQYMGAAGNFELTGGIGGRFNTLSIEGERIRPGGSQNEIRIPAVKLSLWLTLSKPVRVKLLGGLITIPAGTPLYITNDTPITMVGSTLNGLLTYKAQDIVWKDASASLPFQLPHVRFSSNSDGPVTLRIDIRAGVTQITSAKFVSSGLSTTRIDVANDAYRIRLRSVGSSRIRSDINPTRIRLAAEDVDVRGAFVAKTSTALAAPVVADGRMHVQNLNVEVQASASPQAVERFEMVGFQYSPSPATVSTYYTADDLSLAKALNVRVLDEDQEIATKESLSGLKGTGQFNFYTFIPAKDFAKPLKQALERSGLFSKVQDVTLRPQQIVASGLIASGLPKEQAIIKITPSIVVRSLILRASIDFIEPAPTTISRITSDALLSSAAAKINDTVASFDGAHIEWPVPLSLPIVNVPKIAEHREIKGRATVDIGADQVALTMSLVNSVILVDQPGIRALASVVLQ